MHLAHAYFNENKLSKSPSQGYLAVEGDGISLLGESLPLHQIIEVIERLQSFNSNFAADEIASGSSFGKIIITKEAFQNWKKNGHLMVGAWKIWGKKQKNYLTSETDR